MGPGTVLGQPPREAQLADFTKNIPDPAFITYFFMEIGGEGHVARVEEKEKVEETSLKALSLGLGAEGI